MINFEGMKWMFPLLLLCWISTVSGQTPSDCSIPTWLENEYHDDVRFLAMNRIIATNAPAMDSLFVPLAYLDTVWEGLAAIYNVQNMPERDTVFDLYCIHQYLGGEATVNLFTVSVDTTYAWTNNWQNLTTPTGVPQLDSILSLTQLSVVNFSPYFNNATLLTPLDLNSSGVHSALLNIDGITEVDGWEINGDGNWLTYSTSAGIRHYSFELACEDCPSGCMGHRIWNFSVTPTCEVSFDGMQDFGGTSCINDPDLQCGYTAIGNSEKAEFPIYPNPTNGVFQMQLSDWNGAKDLSVTVCDKLGRRMESLKPQTSTIEIDASAWPNGVYSVSLINQSGAQHTERLVMQH
ncbi:MAG: T9SS type A sorting domain-containing protein [Flavobacteriales bacterium]|nr:T9SS type A sorting domain-containing protein [Flavobacteriales bacterium]